MNPPVDYAKQPWKHPACWNAHIVRMTRDYPEGKPVSVATCECGWISRMLIGKPREQDKAIDAHWLDVIAKAEGQAA